MAVAAAGRLTAATACSSQQDTFTEADLIAALRERGVLFELHLADAETAEAFSDLNGLVTTNEFRWRVRERLHISHFTGRGEALVAASRMSMDGFDLRYPDDSYTGWVAASVNSTPVSVYLHGPLIVTYAGTDTEVPEALDEIIGQPVAGYRALGKRLEQGDEFPPFQNLWKEHDAEFRSISHRKYAYGVSNPWVVYFQARVLHSSSCAGGPMVVTGEKDGDEIRITVSQKVLNLGVAGLSGECDIEWEWQDFHYNTALPYNTTHNLIINGKHAAWITPRL